MGIAQRQTVVKRHDTKPVQSPSGRVHAEHTVTWATGNAMCVPEGGGGPAAKPPHQNARHGPEPKLLTPFRNGGQAFSAPIVYRPCAPHLTVTCTPRQCGSRSPDSSDTQRGTDPRSQTLPAPLPLPTRIPTWRCYMIDALRRLADARSRPLAPALGLFITTGIFATSRSTHA